LSNPDVKSQNPKQEQKGKKAEINPRATAVKHQVTVTRKGDIIVTIIECPRRKEYKGKNPRRCTYASVCKTKKKSKGIEVSANTEKTY
jgi:hypothetical protein